jgi:hypothetical protein
MRKKNIVAMFLLLQNTENLLEINQSADSFGVEYFIFQFANQKFKE